MKIQSILISFIISICSTCFVTAHQNTKLKYEKGIITGLPKEYLPAGFNSDSLTLTLANKKLIFPRVLQDILTHDVQDDPDAIDGPDFPFAGPPKHKELRPFNVDFTLSWYPDLFTEELKPYMYIILTSKDSSYSIELLIDLAKLQFRESNIRIKNLGLVPIQIHKPIKMENKSQ